MRRGHELRVVVLGVEERGQVVVERRQHELAVGAGEREPPVRADEEPPGRNSRLRPDFNVRVIERFGPDSSAALRELDESDRFVQTSAESTSM